MKALTHRTPDGTYQWTQLPCDIFGKGAAGTTVQKGGVQVPPGHVLIDVAAAGLNRADLAQMAGVYPNPYGQPDWLGLECSGTVACVGAGVSDWQPGDLCCALVAGGACAEQLICAADLLLPVPDGMDLCAAAALPEAYATAWLNLIDKARMGRDDVALIHAGASGVGLAAVHIARRYAAEVAVTAGSEPKRQLCTQQGASAAFARGDGWDDALLQWRPQGVDVVLDPVGGGYFAANSRVLAPDGRWVLIGLMGGAQAHINLGALLVKRQTLMGSTLRALGTARKKTLLRDMHKALWPLLERGDIAPVIDSLVPIEDWQRGVARMRADANSGKILFAIG